MKPRFLFTRILATSALCFAVGVGALNGCQTVEQRMIAEISEVERDFDAEARYAAYLEKHGENARKLRETAASCSSMRFRIHGGGGVYQKVDEYLPLTAEEVPAVREILAQIEETPARDFSSWLKIQHENTVCPVYAPPPYFIEFQFVSSSGEVLHYFEGYDAPIGDKAKAEEYRTSLSRPYYMLPTDSLRRWEELKFIKRVKAREAELYATFDNSHSESY